MKVKFWIREARIRKMRLVAMVGPSPVAKSWLYVVKASC